MEKQKRKKHGAHNESKSLWNYTLSPGWSQEEVKILKLALQKFGIGKWRSIIQSECLPDKSIGQIYIQTQRMLGQQSLGDFMGLQIDLEKVWIDNNQKKGVMRKNGCVINTGDNPNKEERKQRIEDNRQKYNSQTKQHLLEKNKLTFDLQGQQKILKSWESKFSFFIQQFSQVSLLSMLQFIHYFLKISYTSTILHNLRGSKIIQVLFEINKIKLPRFKNDCVAKYFTIQEIENDQFTTIEKLQHFVNLEVEIDKKLKKILFMKSNTNGNGILNGNGNHITNNHLDEQK